MTKHTNDETITVATVNDISEANAAKARLEAAGIDTFFVDQNVVGLDPVAGIQVRVFAADLKKAREILLQSNTTG